jgi:hypothetical protein
MAKAKHQSTGAGLVFLLGLVLVGTGVGFATAPQYSWHVMKVAKQAANLGIQNGVLVVGGLVLFGLAIVARRIGSSQPVVEPEDSALAEEVRVLNEQLTAKLAQMRTAQLQLAESLAAVAAEQQSHFQKAGERSGPGDQGSDALFRLAASLDKLNAHLDERIHSIDLQVRSGMETLAGEIRRITASRVEPVAPARGPFGTAELGVAHARPHPHAAVHAPEGAIDFYETMQKLDAIAGEDAGLPVDEEPPAPFSSTGGSTLDTLLPEDYRKQY